MHVIQEMEANRWTEQHKKTHKNGFVLSIFVGFAILSCFSWSLPFASRLILSLSCARIFGSLSHNGTVHSFVWKILIQLWTKFARYHTHSLMVEQKRTLWKREKNGNTSINTWCTKRAHVPYFTFSIINYWFFTHPCKFVQDVNQLWNVHPINSRMCVISSVYFSMVVNILHRVEFSSNSV